LLTATVLCDPLPTRKLATIAVTEIAAKTPLAATACRYHSVLEPIAFSHKVCEIKAIPPKPKVTAMSLEGPWKLIDKVTNAMAKRPTPAKFISLSLL
jgi:hypothetical protein